jgi:hypothetical protein
VNIYEAFETSDELTEKGRWIELEFAGAVLASIRIRSASPDLNADLRKAMAEEAVATIATMQGLTDSVADPELENRLFGEAVVTAWKGITDRKGKAIKCTPKNVAKVFKDLPLLAQRVKREAYKWTNFRTQFEETALGN